MELEETGCLHVLLLYHVSSMCFFSFSLFFFFFFIFPIWPTCNRDRKNPIFVCKPPLKSRIQAETGVERRYTYLKPPKTPHKHPHHLSHS